MNSELERYRIILIRIIIVLTLIVTAFFTINYFFPLLINLSSFLIWGFLPFILAVVISILIDPLVDWLTKNNRIKRGLAVTISLVVLFTGITLIIVFAASRLVVELGGLYNNLPNYAQHVRDFGLQTIEQVRNYITNNPLPNEAKEALTENVQVVIKGLSDILTALTNFLFSLLTGLPSFFTLIIITGLATFFISRDKRLITQFIYSYTPKKYIKPASTVVGEITAAVLGFFRAQAILISITGFLTVIGLLILDIEYALTLGIVVGLFDLLPILGPGTIIVPWSMVNFLNGNYSLGFALLVLYAVLVGARQLLEPKVLSRNIGLHPLATLLALYVGLKFIGVWGIIIGPFILIVVKAIIKSNSTRIGG